MELNRGKNNVRSLFKVTDIPTDDQIRNVFDMTEQEDLERIYYPDSQITLRNFNIQKYSSEEPF